MALKQRKGQSTGEYAILFGIVLGAVVMMQTFVRNGIAGGIQSAGDNYRNSLGGNWTTPTINRTSDSSSDSAALMTGALTGNINQSSQSGSVMGE